MINIVEFLGDDEEANFTNALYVCYKNIESCCSCDIISKIIIFSCKSSHELVDILMNIEVYPHSTETRSIKEDILLDVVIKPIKVGADEVVIPPVGQKYNETVSLKRKRFDECNQLVSIPGFPSKINFTIEFKNENIK
ncbi:hypothetical protein ACTFIT_007854 [Dictyostelium discoideum]